LNQRLDELIAKEGRQAKDVRRSLMTNVLFGRDDAEVAQKLGPRDAADLKARGILVGTKGALQDQLDTLAEAGVHRALLQWLDLDDTDGLEAFAAAVL
jgi:alkanesulfonate monooxygenase SsuD/methylene tetrahydromethanopterin reductase-like flavin-dependent oxidoreductase (luciferase family)